MIMIIYQTTNLINGKIYVGQHNTSADDGYLGSGTILKRAINLYGKENFKREILEFVDETNFSDREIYWIAQQSATTYYGNYNITSGGGKPMYGDNNPMHGKKHTPEVIDFLKKFRMGKIPWNKGLTKDTDNRVKINGENTSKTQKKLGISKGNKNPMWGKTGTKSPHFGIKKSKEHKRKMSITKLGNKNPNSKLCKIISPNNIIYDNVIINEWWRKYKDVYKIPKSFLRGIANNKIKNNKNWKCEYK